MGFVFTWPGVRLCLTFAVASDVRAFDLLWRPRFSSLSSQGFPRNFF